MSNEKFTVELTQAAEKDLKNLRPSIDRATNELLKLEQNPYAGHSLSGDLRNVRSREFSLPGGVYRTAYVILASARVCIVSMVGSHEGFYQITVKSGSLSGPELRTPEALH